jgi:hypothetical protein
MKPHSRYVVHLGINFITIPVPIISHQTNLMFQQAVISHGLEFIKIESPKNQVVLTRESPSPLQVTISALEPQIGQVLIVAPNPKVSLELFIQEAEAALNAFEEVWSTQGRQIIRCDATIRELHETSGKHAFQELWEQRLNQSSQALAAFGRPIRGGGLRFVMDPVPNESEPIQIEVKIESFLRDTSKLFVESQFIWPQPSPQGAPFNVRERLAQMDSYIQNQVYSFLSGGLK